MPTNVPLPALGESVTEGTISRWLKAVGDTVDADEALVIADRVRAAIARPVVIDDFEVRPGCSVGVALSGGDMSSFASSELNDLLRNVAVQAKVTIQKGNDEFPDDSNQVRDLYAVAE